MCRHRGDLKMGPIELVIVIALGLLLGGYRLLPRWGAAIGEIVGLMDRNIER